MLSIFYANASKTKPIGCLNRLYKISTNHNVVQVAFMNRLAFKEVYPKPPPFPYWKKKCVENNMYRDPTSLRYDENTKLIVVDGPPAIGKTEFCQRLAKEFGLLYMPSPTHEEIYIDRNGFDRRIVDHKLPESCRSFTLNQFLADPHAMHVAQFQFDYLVMRVEQYLNALLHVFATGQGVILNRSMFSDIAFVYAMHRAGYFWKEEVIQYEKMRDCAISYVLKPHLVIYLDAPADFVLEKIKRKGNPDEVNSKVFTKQYISDFREATTDRVLMPLEPHSQILIYDWSKEINFDDVISDIERLDLEPKSSRAKLGQWVFMVTSDIIHFMETCQQKLIIFSRMMNSFSCTASPRLGISEEDDEIREQIFDEEKEMRYAANYNPFLKQKYLFKSNKMIGNCHFRLSPRDFVNFEHEVKAPF